MTYDEIIDKYIGRENFERYIESENKRIEKLNEEHMRKEHVAGFMAGNEGVCPKCGELAEPQDSDEGPGSDHWFERYWVCECGCCFAERFQMVPVAVWITEV